MKTSAKLLIALLFMTHLVNGQTNFDTYQTLKSQGNMPDDFKLAVKAKMEQNEIDLSTINKKNQKEFLEHIHYGIDQLLNSGSVTYGNDVCKYIESVADRLLKDDAALRSKLRFYVLKSNVANAFSTNQGIIFFTTGLIAQFASEAQLAFVLAHEIVHYQKNHVIQSFEYKSNTKKSIEQLSQYSKEHEFEADRESIEMCNKAGYAKEELLGTLDVLLFSHLPFDEYKFDVSYFNTDYFFVPSSQYSNKQFEIDVNENFNDSLSTHPNIEKRRIEIEKNLSKFSNWGKETNLFGEAKFKDIRNICRFETIRNRIIQGEIPYALYEIFVLEKEFPSSQALQGLKAHAWYEMIRNRTSGVWKAMFPKEKELEGASGQFFYFLMNQKQDQTFTYALRNVFDVYKKYPQDQYIKTIYENTTDLLRKSSSFKISKFYEYTYLQALEKIAQNKLAQETSVATEKKENVDDSKYTRIRRSSTKNIDAIDGASLDSVNYHYYGISDILAESSFKTMMNKNDDLIDTLVVSSKKTAKKNSNKGLSSEFKVTSSISKGEKLILTKPLIFTNTTSNNAKRNVEIKPMVESAIDYALKSTKTIHEKIGSHSGDENYTTEIYNQNALIHDLLIQTGDFSDQSNPIISVNYTQLHQLKKELGASKIAYFFYGENEKEKIKYGLIFGFIWNPAALGINLLSQTSSRYRSVAAVFTYDIETGVRSAASAISITSKPTKHVLQSSMFNLIQTK